MSSYATLWNEHLVNKRLDVEKIPFIPYSALNYSENALKYFDWDGILHETSISNMTQENLLRGVVLFETGGGFVSHLPMSTGNGEKLFAKAVNQLKVGDTFQHFLEICKETRYEIHHYDRLDRFIAKIKRPTVERETDNLNRNAFDFVRIQVCLNDLDGNIRKDIKTHKHIIFEKALNKIRQDPRYKKYGVPVEYLKLTKATLTKDNTLELLFELKL